MSEEQSLLQRVSSFFSRPSSIADLTTVVQQNEESFTDFRFDHKVKENDVMDMDWLERFFILHPPKELGETTEDAMEKLREFNSKRPRDYVRRILPDAVPQNLETSEPSETASNKNRRVVLEEDAILAGVLQEQDNGEAANLPVPPPTTEDAVITSVVDATSTRAARKVTNQNAAIYIDDEAEEDPSYPGKKDKLHPPRAKRLVKNSTQDSTENAPQNSIPLLSEACPQSDLRFKPGSIAGTLRKAESRLTNSNVTIEDLQEIFAVVTSCGTGGSFATTEQEEAHLRNLLRLEEKNSLAQNVLCYEQGRLFENCYYRLPKDDQSYAELARRFANVTTSKPVCDNTIKYRINYYRLCSQYKKFLRCAGMYSKLAKENEGDKLLEFLMRDNNKEWADKFK